MKNDAESSTSSEDVNLDQFKEAADSQFINDDMFKEKSKKKGTRFKYSFK